MAKEGAYNLCMFLIGVHYEIVWMDCFEKRRGLLTDISIDYMIEYLSYLATCSSTNSLLLHI
jgi:hypothetical protein